MRLLTIKRGNFNSVCFSNDGRYLFGLHSLKRVRVWDTATFQEVANFSFYPEITTSLRLRGQVAITDELLLSFEDLFAWLDGPRSSPLSGLPWRIFPKSVTRRNYSLAGDGETILSTLRVTLEQTKELLLFKDLNAEPTVRVIANYENQQPTLAPNGRDVVWRGEKNVNIFDENRELIRQLKHPCRATAVVYSLDGKFLFVAAGRCLWRWDLKTNQSQREPPFQEDIRALVLNKEGSLLGVSDAAGEIQLWDVVSWRRLAALNFRVGAISDLAFSPDGMLAAGAGHKNAVVVWDLD